MKKYFLLCAALVLFLGACRHPGEEQDSGDKFIACDFTKSRYDPQYYYQVSAERIYEGQKCIIYAENNSGVTKDDAVQFAREYDEKIYSMTVENFCNEDFDVSTPWGEKIRYENTLEYAYSMTAGENKLYILLLDIRDGYRQGYQDSYIAGYFTPINLYNGNNSNYRTMIYVDTYPGMNKKDGMYSTFAHELQHLVNYVTTTLNRQYSMDTWIDEGLSSMAEYLYLGAPLKSLCEWFVDDPAGTIAQGNNFYVWDNYQEKPDAIMDEYATVYLFFQWLYLQADNNNFLKNIADSSKYDYTAVTENAALIKPEWSDWETLLRTWLAANYINNPANEFGYKSTEPLLQDIGVKIIGPPNYFNNTIALYPGEGVYSIINSSYKPGSSGANIRYAGLQKGPPGSVNYSGDQYTGNVLLTFNKNTSGSRLENGSVTGVPGAPAASPAMGLSAPVNFSEPRRIDARDIIGRNNEEFLLPRQGKKAGK